MIAAVVASYGRLNLLDRLLKSLRRVEPEAPALFLIDNLGDGGAAKVAAANGFASARVINPGRNLGTGGGVAVGFQEALKDPTIRYCLQLDDDAVVSPGALAGLVKALDASGTGAAMPMMIRANGNIGWFPGLKDRRKWRVVLRARQGLRPEDYLAECGEATVPFTWAAWPVLMVTRSAIEQVGVPREDIWFQAVDLEYTLRLAYYVGNIWVPSERCWHLPPDGEIVQRRAYWRDCVGLHNCSYIFTRLPHGRLALRHLPGNYWRFFRSWGLAPSVLADALRCFVWGTVKAKPAGAPGYTRFKERWFDQR
ncbi:hypothetical protein MASR2M8_25440 [Opitutaceae bacterium]